MPISLIWMITVFLMGLDLYHYPYGDTKTLSAYVILAIHLTAGGLLRKAIKRF